MQYAAVGWLLLGYALCRVQYWTTGAPFWASALVVDEGVGRSVALALLAPTLLWVLVILLPMVLAWKQAA